ncbi:MAG: CbiX/SirB N-terminal domain-containing protein [Rubrivivax sp.]|nr:CbiX/SirB N-terminal domain-containing protein [Rubrivivax sp.]
MQTGLILFAHGARDPRWAAPFQAVAAALQAARPGLPVQLAFLEFMTPTLPEAGASLAAQGCRAIQVLPMFLGAGGHVRKDLPLLIDTLQAAQPGLQITLLPAIGEVDSVTAAMAAAALQLLDGAR